MVMEAEVPGLLKLGVGTVMTVAILFILFLWAKSRNGGFGWMFAHLVLLAWALIGVFEVLDTRGDRTASSIHNSLKLAWSGIIWAAGMGCLLIGALLLRPVKGDRR